MKCPFCSSENTRVIDSRPADDNNSIRRRRLCDECGKRFTTYEKVETIPLIVIKKDNNREQYDRSKIEAGVLRACHKRPISVNQINQLVDEVETEIFNREEKHRRARLCRISAMEIQQTLQDRLEHLASTDRRQILAQVYRHIRRHRRLHHHFLVFRDRVSLRAQYSQWILKFRISLKIQENNI